MNRATRHPLSILGRVKRRASYANITATLALVLAMGGTSYAAFILPANSVGNRQLRPGAVTATKIHAGAITDRQIRSYSLTGRAIDKHRLGRVPSAVHAVTATSATRAHDAQTLNGVSAAALKVRCPAGTVLNAGGCIELATRTAASFGNAASQCAERRLATPAELESLRVQYSDQVGSATEMTSDLTDQANLITVNLATGATSTSPVSTPLPFRCVALPAN